MEHFPYGTAEIAHLARRDPALGRAMRDIGRVERQVWPDVFQALTRSILAQQIAAKAVETVWGRLEALAGEIAPMALAALAPEAVQGCGMTMAKARSLVAVARLTASGQADLNGLAALDDGQALKRLTALPGVGPWTAEMTLLFGLLRPDVLSWGDLAIRRGMARLYGLETLGRPFFEERRRTYSPHGSVASLYLWRLAAK